jgi:hypothetical protein
MIRFLTESNPNVILYSDSKQDRNSFQFWASLVGIASERTSVSAAIFLNAAEPIGKENAKVRLCMGKNDAELKEDTIHFYSCVFLENAHGWWEEKVALMCIWKEDGAVMAEFSFSEFGNFVPTGCEPNRSEIENTGEMALCVGSKLMQVFPSNLHCEWMINEKEFGHVNMSRGILVFDALRRLQWSLTL